MSKCKHAKGMKEPWDNIIGLTVTYADGTKELVGHERCWKCHETLSIGPANESDERVRVEIRAAELAWESMLFVSHEESPWTCTPEAIAGGFICAEWKPGESFSDVLIGPEEEAGYLSWWIEDEHKPNASHEEQP